MSAKIIVMVIDEFIASKEKILNTHNWAEPYYITSNIGGKPHMTHKVEKCQDCHEFKSYNRSDLKPCAGSPNARRNRELNETILI
jgi:hypothetical protein